MGNATYSSEEQISPFGPAGTNETACAADRNTLTRQYIYSGDVSSKEGARVVTSASKIVDRCN